MVRAVITRNPPSWEKDSFKNEPQRYIPPHLFLAPRACFAGLQFFSEDEKKEYSSAFVYISRYTNKHNERFCRLERLGFSSLSREAQLEIIEKIYEIATQIFGPIQILESELFSKVESPLFFPSTLYFLGSCNKSESLDLYRNAGFKSIQTKYCYEIDLNSTQVKNLSSSDVKLALRPIRREEWSTYWDLWGQSDYCLNTNYPFKSLSNATFSDFVPIPSDLPHMITRRRNLGFLSKVILGDNSSPIGFVQWAPNIYRLAPLTKSSISRYERFSEIKEAKIFKLCMKSKLQTDLLGNILDLALSTLKAKGFEKCQIGNFTENDPIVALLRAKSIALHVHTVDTFQKRI